MSTFACNYHQTHHHHRPPQPLEFKYPCAYPTEIVAAGMKIGFPKIGSKCVSYFGHLGLSLTSNAPLTLSEWTYCPSNDQPPSPSDFTVTTEETNSGTGSVEKGGRNPQKTLQGGQMRMGRTCDDVVINLTVSPLGMAVPVKPLSPVVRKASGRGP